MGALVPLTPVDIHNMSFGKSSLGKRGYDEEQVDSLLDAVTQEMIQLLEENDALRDRARHADAAVAASSAASASASDNAKAAELQAASAELNRARRACDQAEQAARKLQGRLAEARQAAAAARPAARPPADDSRTDRVLALAQRTADDHMQNAHQESDGLLSDAQQRSADIIRQAQATGADIDEGARRHHREAIEALQDRRGTLLREIAELTEFAANYRAALHDHVVQQGLQLDDVAVAELELPAR